MIEVEFYRGYNSRSSSDRFKALNMDHNGRFRKQFDCVEHLVRYLVDNPSAYIHSCNMTSEQRIVMNNKFRSMIRKASRK